MEPVLIEHLKYHLNDIICRDIDVFYKEGEYTYSMFFINIYIYKYIENYYIKFRSGLQMDNQ